MPLGAPQLLPRDPNRDRVQKRTGLPDLGQLLQGDEKHLLDGIVQRRSWRSPAPQHAGHEPVVFTDEFLLGRAGRCHTRLGHRAFDRQGVAEHMPEGDLERRI